MHKSHKLHALLNYFDEKDVRVRELPYTIDAQLLNGVAVQLEDVELRVNREIAARTLATTPVHLDNRGVYHAVRVDNSLSLVENQTTLSTVQGRRAGQWVTLTPWDDRLPIPSAYVADDTRVCVPLTNPVLFDVTGSGEAHDHVWDVKSVTPDVFPIPNHLTFYVEGLASPTLFLSILIEGETVPIPVWTRDRRNTSEVLVQSSEGVFTTTKIWATVSRVVVRGLPLGARLRCWSMPFTVPVVPDTSRPYVRAADRDVQFDRYWTLSSDENLLKEMFLLSNLSGLEVAHTYALPFPLSALAVEPHTWGLLTGGGTTLLYTDRREPLPARLDVTGLTREPLYGLDCQYNFTLPGAARYLHIRPVPYGRASKMALWRYLVEDPTGTLTVLLPDGSVVAYSGRAGWQRGQPTAVNLPLVHLGTYVITMECLDSQDQMSSDCFPYPNLVVTGTVCDISRLVSTIKGLAFDSRERLWVWTGDYAVPVRPRYDCYVLDVPTRMLYVTSAFDAIRYE